MTRPVTSAEALPEIYLVPHSHWDREWYEPFQRFRLHLVDLLDAVIGRAERDPRFRFTLDGQTAMVDDYLEMRPEMRDRVAALARSGQLAIGPWHILLDEFLVSGENIARNLELGAARAADFGGRMPVGYLPDQFGHCAQMPQLLRATGLDHACLWRGVPAAVDRHVFRWQAPDGSTLRTEYLPEGYGNVADLFHYPDAAGEAARTIAERMRPFFGDEPVLGMYGGDHAMPLSRLTDTLAALERADIPVRLATLTDYCAARRTGEVAATWIGELRSHARANILPGVVSVRVPLKRAMARAERVVERYAEPFCALWLPEWPARPLDLAWRRLIESSGHDSITGCGVDETAAQVAARIAEAEQLGTALRDRTVAQLARRVPAQSVLVVNPTPAPRRGLVMCDVPVSEDWPGVALELPDGQRVPTQQVDAPARVLTEEELDAGDLDGVFRRLHGRELFGRDVRGWEIASEGDTPVLTFHVGRTPGHETFRPWEARAVVGDEAARRPGRWLLRIVDESRRGVLAEVPVGPLGWTTCRAVPGDLPVHAPVTCTNGVLDNGLLRASVRPDGALRLDATDGTTVDGVGRVVDGGDQGDSYNYGPPAADTLIGAPQAVEVSAEMSGPLAAAVLVERTYQWPLALEATASRRCEATRSVTVRTRAELRSGEPFLRLTMSFDNPCADHRVRLHLPLARPADVSSAEGQFSVTQRGLTAEGGCGEEPLPTYPAHGFVQAGGLAVLLAQPTEYELVSDGRELALTLLRAVGWLSRNVHPYREEPAGPELATPGAQCRERVTVDLALHPHQGSWEDADAMQACERFRHEFHAAPGTGSGELALARANGIEVSGNGVVMTSLRRRDGALELRLVAERAEPTTAVVSGPFTAARRCDLLGEPGESLPVTGGQLEVPLRAWEIATVQLLQQDSDPSG